MPASTDPVIGQMMARLEISPLPIPTVARPEIVTIGLSSMPDDILNSIGGLLLNGHFLSSEQGYIRHCKVKPSEVHGRSLRLHDFLAFATCCKGIRTAVFGRWILRMLVLWLCEQELAGVEALPEFARRDVRTLFIFPGPGAQTSSSSTRPFSWLDFIRLFPNLESVWIRWCFFSESDPRRVGLKAAAAAEPLTEEGTRQASSDDGRPPPSITSVHIETLDPWDAAVGGKVLVFLEDYDGTDIDRIEQLHCLFSQLQSFTQLRNLGINLGSFTRMHVAGSEPLWDSLIRAFGHCVLCKGLENVRLECRMIMQGQAIGIDLCALQDVWTKILQTGWLSPTMKSIIIDLVYIGQGGDSYRFWAVPPTMNRLAQEDRISNLCHAVLPPTTRLLELLNKVRQDRPQLTGFSINVECKIPWCPTKTMYTPAKWSFLYSSELQTDVKDDELVFWEPADHDRVDPVKITTVSVEDGQYALLSVKDTKVHRACDFILKEQTINRNLSIYGGSGRSPT